MMDLATDLFHSPLFLWYAGMSILTFVYYGYDKQKAKDGEWRVSEKTLFSLAFLGGFAGALAGMVVFWHKVRKSYFWLTNVAIMVGHYYLLQWLGLNPFSDSPQLGPDNNSTD